ncbi:MAG: tetratricopeptide repeat protein [Cyclobacteriaceae bacterium]|nr:tetratricopeptide repeat protein [Cyclobacteriaceae bacterium]
MKIYLFLSVLIYIVPIQLTGQQLLDSLQQEMKGASDSLKVELYIEMSRAVVSRDMVAALAYAQNAEKVALNMGDRLQLAKSWNTQGVYYYYLNELELSNELYYQALSIFDSLQYIHGIANSLNNLGWNYKVQNRIDEAIEYFNKALAYAEKTNDPNLVQAILNNFGTVYRNQKEYDKALGIYERSLQINRQLGNKKWEAYNLNNIGLVNMDMGYLQNALEHLELAREINRTQGFLEELTRNTLNMAKVYILKKDFGSAERYLHDAHLAIEANGFKRLRLEYFNYLVDLCESKGDYKKALEYEREQNRLNNELNRLAYDEKMAELQTKFEVAENARNLNLAERKLSQQRLVIISGIAMFFLLFGILILVLKLFKSNNAWAKSIQKLNSEIEDKAEALRLMNEEVKMINSNLEKAVEDRTDKIKAQNQKLVEYAFINSHEIRGPLARVMGLVYLMGLENKILLGDESFAMLMEATFELDHVIKKASQLLENEEILTK